MPYLTKPKRKRTSHRTDNRNARQRIYCTEEWKRLRRGYLMQQPTCELCDRRGIITLAVDVHHARSFQLLKGAERIFYAFSPTNLIALCKECHAWVHRHGPTYETDLDAEAKAADETFGPGIIPTKMI